MMIEELLNQRNYDVRISGNARWIDQKCTPDVVSIIADCIVEYFNTSGNNNFTTRDIWHSPYAANNILQLFSKPSVIEPSAQNEYDKFFQQPMELLAYAGVLHKKKCGRSNIYTVNNFDLLDFIAQRERNALVFLQKYIYKVLHDSELLTAFNYFFNNQNKNAFNTLKKAFTEFTINNTAINYPTECGRIFTKILNPLAFLYQSKGTEKGHLSSDIITYDKLMYNRANFRDLYTNKPKNTTRQEYRDNNPELFNNVEINYKYQSAKAKKYLRKFNDRFNCGYTEHLEPNTPLEKNQATNIHHIFPEADYPEISDYYENLIALTPTQHYNNAHAGFNTQYIDETYQHLLLLSKVDRIQENLFNLQGIPIIYDFEALKYVLQQGLDDYSIYQIPSGDFIGIKYAINHYYNSKQC